jgi:RNA polymerase sigma-70 factor, ECF subfamily
MLSSTEFEAIVGQYESRLAAYARRVVTSTEDAEEVVQDAFMRAFRALNAMSEADRAALPLRPWLFTITLNVARNRLRKKRPAQVSLDAVLDPERLVYEDRTSETPESVLEEHASRELISQAIRTVPLTLRKTAALRFIAGLSNAEIAERVGRPVNTVKSRVHRAAQVMRRVLAAELRAA